MDVYRIALMQALNEVSDLKAAIKEFQVQAEKCEFNDVVGHKLENNQGYVQLIQLGDRL